MIVKMNFLSITGPREDIDRVVNQYFTKYEIHLENALTELTTLRNLTPFLEINPYRSDLDIINRYYSLLEEPEKLTPFPMETEKAVAFSRNLEQELSSLEEGLVPLRQEYDRLNKEMQMFYPLRNMDSDLSVILHFKHMHHRFGRIERSHYPKFESYVYRSADSFFYKCDEDDQYVWGIYFVPIKDAKKLDAIYNSMHFEYFMIPDLYEGTGQEIYYNLKEQFDRTDHLIQKNGEKKKRLIAEQAEKIVSAKRTLENLSTNFDVRRLAACTKDRSKNEEYYILCGWMTEEDAKAFQDEIKNDDRIVCIVEDHDADNSNLPPTKLKNPKIFKPFEMYVKMFGLPSYSDMDPTVFVGITYAFIFGVMFGDVGQGLLLLIGGAILYRKKGMELAGIISTAGIFSTIFGFMFGSLFGFEDILPALWLRPRTDMITLPMIGSMNTVFVVAVAFGMFMILMTMFLHIYAAVKTKNIEKMLFDQNALAGVLFYGALAVVIVLFMTGHKLPAGMLLAALFVIPLLVIMFKEPLARLAEKKHPIIEGGIGMYLVQSFFETFEVLLSYFSNTVSFVRIGAFAVSHAAMMEVVLMLAGAEHGGSPNWLVVVLGNLFVCAMEGLIVGIQVLRLEYYEMFSRFYDGGGKEFVPFIKKNTK